MVLTLLHRLVEFGMRDRLGQIGEEGMVFVCQRAIEEGYMRCESGTSDLIIVAIEAPAHGIEERVGKVTCVVGLIRRGLYTIVLRYNLAKIAGGGLQGCLQLLKRIGLLHERHAAANGNSVLHDVADEVPLE